MSTVTHALALMLAAAPSTAGALADGELHTFHCLHGCPLGAPGTNDTIVRENYTMSSNDITRMADWVAYRVTATTIGPSGGREWEADPSLSPDERLAPSDYDGAPQALRIDRGHQAPLASFSGTPTASETNILSNITPQASALNQGPWVRLENRERELALRIGQPVYVYTGPIFERLMRSLPNATVPHRVPSGYWKVVALADGRAVGFVFDQSTPRGADLCLARVAIADLELRVRLRLFPMAPRPLTEPLDAELGCSGAAPSAPPPDEIP